MTHRHRTMLEIPADHRVTPSRTTQLGHRSLVETPPSPAPKRRAAPWREEVYVSPSGRIFLPPGFDFDTGRPRTLTRTSVRRQPPPPRPEPRRARVVMGWVEPAPASRHPTRESWVVPAHLRAG